MQANHAMRLLHEDKEKTKTSCQNDIAHVMFVICGSYMENNVECINKKKNVYHDVIYGTLQMFLH